MIKKWLANRADCKYEREYERGYEYAASKLLRDGFTHSKVPAPGAAFDQTPFDDGIYQARRDSYAIVRAVVVNEKICPHLEYVRGRDESNKLRCMKNGKIIIPIGD